MLSGPAGGVAGSRHAARLIGQGDLMLFDMGGTSTDLSLVVGGEAQIASDRRIAGQRVALQALDIVSIGAGGGSIARVDAGGVLHVGPESAGAEPGPACYGRGGLDATVTDANLVLGFLDPDNFLGGRAHLDPAAAAAAVDRIASALGVERVAPPKASIASSTRAWPRASGWCRCAAASIRAASRSSPSAALRACTSPTSPASSN